MQLHLPPSPAALAYRDPRRSFGSSVGSAVSFRTPPPPVDPPSVIHPEKRVTVSPFVNTISFFREPRPGVLAEVTGAGFMDRFCGV